MTSTIESIEWHQIKVISFDLDDTLWDNSGVIEKCLAESYQYLCQREPLIKKHFTIDSMERITEQLIELEQPEYENMTVLRKAVIKQVLQEVNGDISLVNPAFAIFYHWRNQIVIPETTHRVLEYLARKYTLVATSNGNSNLKKVGLSDYFDRHLIAGIHGRAKPSAEMLSNLLEHYQIDGGQLVHIGDSILTDVMSAKAAGVQSLEMSIKEVPQLLEI
ncbi:HAD-IA family hydrolase [Kangiella sp. HZ709]|uniref:HAD-IA family hydrolase n=1 Tax=Kangiella sp. HZ709 TaxID=2666328 RepID=UPI0012B0CFF8|nr:HAD-IA family hydrolase [Kangiella sp. HZ709]MRX28034.1 HAD-IA family hydrolase [Kangiella sp. HZ709]